MPKTWHMGIFEILQKLLGIFEIFEKLSVNFEIIWKCVGKFEIFWKYSGSFEIILNSSGQFWNYGKIMGSFDIYLPEFFKMFSRHFLRKAPEMSDKKEWERFEDEKARIVSTLAQTSL